MIPSITATTETIDVVLERANNSGVTRVAMPLIASSATSIDETAKMLDDTFVDDLTKATFPFVSYEIYGEASVAVFRLDACVNDAEFYAVLNEFWFVVETEGMDTVVLDLQRNRGGDFTVGPAFFRFLQDAPTPIALFSAQQRQSDELCEQLPAMCAPFFLNLLSTQLGVDTSGDWIDMPSAVISNLFPIVLSQIPPPAQQLFAGELFVLTSDRTFGAAHLIAGVAKANGLGTVVGMPTGNALGGVGSTGIHFDVPHTDLTLVVPTGRTTFLSDDAALQTELGAGALVSRTEAVYPDVLVPPTDFAVDAPLEYVLSLHHAATDNSSSPSAGPPGGVAFVAKPVLLVVGTGMLLFMLAMTTLH